MLKLTTKQMMLLLAISLIVAFLLSSLATWLDWRINPNQLFYSDTAVHWSVVWETFSSWMWPLWLVLVILGCLGFVVVRLVRG